MMAPKMADEYFEKYKRLSHPELYRMLKAGSPRQVATTADAWASIADTLAALAATLTHDLGRLGRTWSGHASREFASRIGLIAEYANALSREAAAMRTGLTVMGNALQQAQRQAESPAAAAVNEADDLPSAHGTGLGWAAPAQEAKRAQERMAWLVAKLAAEYGVVAHGTWPRALPAPPRGMPGVLAIVEEVRERHRDRRHRGTELAGVQRLSTPAPSPAAVPVSGPIAAPAVRHDEWRAATPSELAAPARAASTTASGGSSGGGSSAGGNTNPVSGPAGLSGTGMPVAPVGMTSPMAAGQGQFHLDTSTTAEHLTWQTAENADWSDHDTDAPPSVLGDA